MDIRKQFETDEHLEEDGVWVDLGHGAQVLVARFGNKRHREALEKYRTPHKGLIASGRPLPAEVADQILLHAAADTILLGWRGITENGMTVPYSRQKALEYLRDLKDFRAQIDYVSGQMETFRRQAMEADAGNLSPSSPG